MTPSPIEQDFIQRSSDDTELNRRRLLKAAVSAAPLIATLPSGTAYALASASQCIERDRTLSQGGSVQGGVDIATPDGFNRVVGFRYTFRKGIRPNVSNVVVYSIGATPNPLTPPWTTPFYFGSSGSVTTASGTSTYNIGQEFVPSTFNSGSWAMANPPGPTGTGLLKLYRAESDTGDPFNNPTCANDCTPNVTDPSSQCIFPLSQIGTPDQPGQNPGNNLALTNSCLASVYPPLTGRSCPQ